MTIVQTEQEPRKKLLGEEKREIINNHDDLNQPLNQKRAGFTRYLHHYATAMPFWVNTLSISFFKRLE